MPGIEKRMQVSFMGRVQGVGFRYTVTSIAASYNVNGYVRNEFDGSVVMIAEGPEAILFEFLDAILNSGLKRYILNHTVDWFPAKNQFTTFGIRF